MTSCMNCEWAAVYRHGMCVACWWYKRRHGVDRPEELIVKHGTRILEARARGV